MPASMMIADTGSTPYVTGSRIAIVAAGPSPGSTPISMPITTPIRQYSRLVGCSDDAEAVEHRVQEVHQIRPRERES